MNFKVINCLLLLFYLVSVNGQDELLSKAIAMAHNTIIIDGHVDLPYRLRVQNFRLEREYLGIPVSSERGDFDYVRAKEGGLDAPFMSIYIPASYEGNGAKTLADTLINMVEGICASHPDKFQIATSPEEIVQNFKSGIVSLPMGMENGAPIEGDLENIDYFYNRGIRYITLTHSKDNHICDSSYDTTGTWKGLSPFGKEVVRRMNHTGIMVDVSHISDDAFYQVMELSQTPVIASHSSCRAFTPEFERNMNDDMLKALAKNNGVIQINFGSSFLDAGIRQKIQESQQEIYRIMDSLGIEEDSAEEEEFIAEYTKENPVLLADVKTVADHIAHVKALIGIDHVGLGSDFDGVGPTLPTGLKDVSQYPNLIRELLFRGYSKSEIEKICYKNVFRVWKAVEKFAAKN